MGNIINKSEYENKNINYKFNINSDFYEKQIFNYCFLLIQKLFLENNHENIDFLCNCFELEWATTEPEYHKNLF